MAAGTDPQSTATERSTLIADLQRKAKRLRDQSIAMNGRTLHAGAALCSAEDGVDVIFKRMGIPDRFVGQVGDWSETRRGIGLARDDVLRTVLQFLE